MKLVASRQLARFPMDLITVANEMVVLTTDQEATFLEAYDAGLEPAWRKRLEASALALVAVDGTPWVLDSEGAWSFGDGGDCLVRVRVRPRAGMRPSAFAPVGDGFVFAWQHDDYTPTRPPMLERVSFDGTVRWSATLPIGKGVAQTRADEGWKPRPMGSWAPDMWYSISSVLPVSGDALLACFGELDRSGIGFGYVVSLADGALRFTTRSGPIDEVAPLGAGEFLVGYQGYGKFETLRYDRSGREAERWESHGYYVVGDDVRVIELENVHSKMHLVRLLPGGEVTKGAWLDGHYTSRPFLDTDGTIYFFRKGDLLSARDLSITERLLLTAGDRSFSTEIVKREQSLYFAYSQESAGTRARLLRIDL
jgi:hypothetical protein